MSGEFPLSEIENKKHLNFPKSDYYRHDSEQDCDTFQEAGEDDVLLTH